jgi:hypothetical protein
MRTIAILIAVAGMIDPGWTAEQPAARKLVAIDLTSGASDAAVAALQNSAPGWEMVPRRSTGSRLPCGVHERCAIIADGSVDAEIPADLGTPVAIVAIRAGGSPNVALRSVSASSVNAAASGALRVELSRTGAVVSTDIRVLDGNAIVGSVTHTWQDGETASLEVPWWPIDTGVRMLRVEAVPIDGEATTIDNAIDRGVTVQGGQARVLVFDARPSWNSTFVRRSVEDDPRFSVEYRSRVAPSLTAGTVGGTLDARTLEETPVVVIGGPDALTDNDVALLERYVRTRGGSLILLPERRVAGSAARLFGGEWTERLIATPESIGPLRAGEILQLERAPETASVLGRSGSSPVMLAMPSGNGRIIISGAMDAWRYRDLNPSGGRGASAYDRFWRSLIADAAAAGESVRLELGHTLVAVSDRVPFTLRRHTFDPIAASEARVSVRCAGQPAVMVRAWPSGTVGEFTGEIPANPASNCEVEARVDGRSTITSYAVAADVRHGVDATLAKLERQARATGGVFTYPGDEAFARTLDAQASDSSQIVSVYPMRSPWWIIPFAGCLSLEWFLRRRHGLR